MECKVSDNHYKNCHAYINRKYGKALKCENVSCNYKNPKRFEWALLKGRNYSKNIEDYIQLCPSCHSYYDFISSLTRNRQFRTSIMGANNSKSKPILQYTLEGDLVKRWESVSMCARELKVCRSNVFANLRGKTKYVRSFVFKYDKE